MTGHAPAQPQHASPAIRRADFSASNDAAALRLLMQVYASDEMGGGQSMAAGDLARLPVELARLPHAMSWIAFLGARPVGLLNAFEGYSTFAAAPLLNIHDLIVDPAVRGTGIGHRLMEAAEAEARRKGCRKITLEVLERNHRAQRLYASLGYGAYRLGDAPSQALFWQKSLR